MASLWRPLLKRSTRMYTDSGWVIMHSCEYIDLVCDFLCNINSLHEKAQYLIDYVETKTGWFGAMVCFKHKALDR